MKGRTAFCLVLVLALATAPFAAAQEGETYELREKFDRIGGLPLPTPAAG